MVTINTKLEKIEKLSVDDQAQAAIEETKETIEDLNRERMLEGRRADGSVMPNYSQISVLVYGYPPGPIRLKATGAFQAAIDVEVGKKSFTTDSKDPKSKMLKTRYGEEIFGMDQPDRVDYVKVLRPVFVKKMKTAL